MENIKILWADDEIDLLKPHILFLEKKGYQVFTSNNGDEALDMAMANRFDIIFLDENMPGLSGLETLSAIKNRYPEIPIVMITKSEEETIMEEAIGSKISDYLIKPVNPNQLLLSLKKNLDHKKLISEKTSVAYQQEFRSLSMQLHPGLSSSEWIEIYKKLSYWELELSDNQDQGIQEILQMQKNEANKLFADFVEKNYIQWLHGKQDDIPVLSHTAMKNYLFDYLDNDKPVFLIVIDNLRYDQWKVIAPFFQSYFRIEKEELYYAILPTATQYARNALFAGLLPSEIEKKYPQYWVHEHEEGSKNKYEEELLNELLSRFGKNIKTSYHKILNLSAAKKLTENLSNLMVNKLNVIVYNFVDMLSHARTDMEILKELAGDEAAYRSITLSWIEHSPLHDIIRFISEKGAQVLLTSDHGSVRCQNPIKILGDKNTNTNLRYKFGRNLNYNAKEVFAIKDPKDAFLPRLNISTSYVFCKEYNYFVYPNNYHHFVNYYRDTFQHGGVSMEEMIIPFVSLTSK